LTITGTRQTLVNAQSTRVVYLGLAGTSWPIIIANCLTLLLAGALLVMKITFG